METKKCSKCGKELPFSEFYKGRNACKKCERQRAKNWRQANPTKHVNQVLRRQKKQSEWLNSQKTPCIICGESEPICIDFHHINPSEKEFTIGKNRNRGKEWLLTEIQKCVCVCSNCHRKIHAGLINLEEYINTNSSPEQRGEA